MQNRTGIATCHGHRRSTPPDSRPPFRRIAKPPLERHRVRHGAEAVADRVGRQVDIHVPLERLAFEPVEDIHGGFVERQRHLEREVTVDLQDRAHASYRTYHEHESMGRALGRHPSAAYQISRVAQKGRQIAATPF